MTSYTYLKIFGWIFFSYFFLTILWDIQAWSVTSKLYDRPLWKQARVMASLVMRSKANYYLWLPAVPVIILTVFILNGASYPLIFIISILPLWIHLILYQILPPSVLVLGTSRHEMFDLRHWLERAVNPYRVVVLLEPLATIGKHDSLSRRTRFNWDNLRTKDGKWRLSAFKLIEMTPILMIDARVDTFGVAEEIHRVSNSNLSPKALFIKNEDGTAPAINNSGINHSLHEIRTVKVSEAVSELKKMGLNRTTSPDDAYLTANISYNYQSKRLEKQMREVSRTGIEVLKALQAANRAYGQTSFIIEVNYLITKLNGNPGDGALEVLSNLKSDLTMTGEFIDKWLNVSEYEYQNVVRSIILVNDALTKLQLIVDQAPPVFLERNEKYLREKYGRNM